VGSGPTLPDPTTCAQARAVLRRYAPSLQGLPLRESLKPTSLGARHLRGRTIMRPEHLVRTFAALPGRNPGGNAPIPRTGYVGPDGLARDGREIVRPSGTSLVAGASRSARARRLSSREGRRARSLGWWRRSPSASDHRSDGHDADCDRDAARTKTRSPAHEGVTVALARVIPNGDATGPEALRRDASPNRSRARSGGNVARAL
jgi:hypothetical protein